MSITIVALLLAVASRLITSRPFSDLPTPWETLEKNGTCQMETHPVSLLFFLLLAITVAIPAYVLHFVCAATALSLHRLLKTIVEQLYIFSVELRHNLPSLIVVITLVILVQ